VDVQGSLTPEPVRVPTPRGGAAAAAAAAGNPRAARELAAANNLDSLRFGGGAPLSIAPGVTVRPPAGSASEVRVGARLNPAALLPKPPTGGVATDRNAVFGVGGKAHVEAPASLRADVGTRATLRARIRFGEG